MKRGQKGFGAVELLLVLILVSILGFTGYYVWHSQKKTNTSYDNTTKANSDSSSSASSSSSQFVFKELGVQFELPASLKGLTYKAQTITSATGGQKTALYLSDKDYATDMEKCYGQKSDGLEFGAIGKSDGQYPTNPTPENTDGGLAKQFKDFYIDVSFPNGITSCTESGVNSALVQNDAKDLLNAFSLAFQKTATEVK